MDASITVYRDAGLRFEIDVDTVNMPPCHSLFLRYSEGEPFRQFTNPWQILQLRDECNRALAVLEAGAIAKEISV